MCQTILIKVRTLHDLLVVEKFSATSDGDRELFLSIRSSNKDINLCKQLLTLGDSICSTDTTLLDVSQDYTYLFEESNHLVYSLFGILTDFVAYRQLANLFVIEVEVVIDVIQFYESTSLSQAICESINIFVLYATSFIHSLYLSDEGVECIHCVGYIL